MPSTSARLFVVATPLGNPGDLSPRAREALSTADIVLAEDTRRARDQFRRWELPARRFVSFHDHNEEARLDEVLAALEQGQSVALISDAGTPLLSDPGYRLVRACREAGCAVTPIPGPSAPITALSAAGLPPLPFSFLGFLPRKAGEVRKLFANWATSPGSLVFFERKDRLGQSLELAREILGPRELCLARELTKTHEEFILGRLEDWPWETGELLGELTVVVGPPERPDMARERDVDELLREAAAQGGKPREVVRRVRDLAPGWSASDLYQRLQELQDDAGLSDGE